jgi:Reverse transcriptase (RNA-dependent DNA polymerase)
MVYAVKHDGRHKARYVAGGHLTETPVDSVYSSVVSLQGIRLLVFIAQLNGLAVWSTDVGNAYLESYTKEKVYIVAGPKIAPFGLEGHILLID